LENRHLRYRISSTTDTCDARVPAYGHHLPDEVRRHYALGVSEQSEARAGGKGFICRFGVDCLVTHATNVLGCGRLLSGTAICNQHERQRGHVSVVGSRSPPTRFGFAFGFRSAEQLTERLPHGLECALGLGLRAAAALHIGDEVGQALGFALLELGPPPAMVIAALLALDYQRFSPNRRACRAVVPQLALPSSRRRLSLPRPRWRLRPCPRFPRAGVRRSRGPHRCCGAADCRVRRLGR
jgi:hypothetical protein